jgi:hypothetical protein
MTLKIIFAIFVGVREAAHRDGSGAEGRKCPILVPPIEAVAYTKQAWGG